MNEFNELFNQYFGSGDRPLNSMERMMRLMARLNMGGGLSGMNPEEANLGEPTSKEEFEEDGVVYVKSTWQTPEGVIVRIETKENIQFSSEYFKKNGIPLGEKITPELTLEEQLEQAVKVENYEKCAELRDLIKKRDEEIQRKENKDLASENLDNKGLPDEDEWNF